MKKQIEKSLRKVLLSDIEMSYELYEFNLEDNIDLWKKGMHEEENEFVIAVIEDNGNVAMLLITNKEELFINELAREKLRQIWHLEDEYSQNIDYLIPDIAKELIKGEILLIGM